MLYSSGSEKFQELQQSNPKVGEFTEKSKQTLGVIGDKITDVSSVRIIIFNNNDRACTIS